MEEKKMEDISKPKPRHKWAKRILIGIAILIVALVVAGAVYINNYSHAGNAALAAVADEDGAADGITVQQLDSKAMAFVPDKPIAGLIFYPGAKVQPEAYATLMQRCAQRGVLCVLLKPPLNLAILDVNAADGMKERFPDVSYWVIGGHSMGGVAACSYAAAHQGAFDALVLLASYSTDDLFSFGGSVLLVRGARDGVLNLQRYDAGKSLLPANTTELVIEGGNHAGFADYGPQANDNPGDISPESQQDQTADAIAELVKRNSMAASCMS